MVHGRVEEAIAIINKVAAVNSCTLPIFTIKPHMDSSNTENTSSISDFLKPNALR